MQGKPHDPFKGQLWNDKLEAIGRSWRALPILIALIIACLWLAVVHTNRANQPMRKEVGQVVRFGSHATDVGDRPLIVVRLRNGTIRQFFIRRAQLQTCRVGDRIRLVRKGDWLGVHRGGCAAL